MQLRDDVAEEESLLLRLFAVADRDRVVRRKVPAIVAGTHVLGSRHARRRARVGLERRRPVEVHVLVRKHAIRGPARGRQRVVIADGVAPVDETLQAQSIRRFAVRGGRFLVGRRRRDDIAFHRLGAVGETIQGVDHLARGRAVFAHRVDRVQDAVFDGDLLRAFGEDVDQTQHPGREQDEETDPTEEAQQVTDHVSASGSSTARPNGR